MMEFTDKELKWLDESRKRFYIGDVFDAMNKRAKEYKDLGKDFAWEQTLQDFQGLFTPSEIKKNEDWDMSDHASFAFVKTS